MRQRVMIAMALPRTGAADRGRAHHRARRHRAGADSRSSCATQGKTGIALLITHDMGVVAEMADRVVVMRVRRGWSKQSAGPQALRRARRRPTPRSCSPRCRAWDDRRPARWQPRGRPAGLLRVRDLTVGFDRDGAGSPPRHVTRVTRSRHRLHLGSGETLALVGESGCGKSTIGAPCASRPSRGTVEIAGRDFRPAAPRRRDARRAPQGADDLPGPVCRRWTPG